MNIFICQTPFQLYYATIIIKHLGFSNNLKFCIIHSNLNCDELNEYSEVELLNSLSSRQTINTVKQLKTIKNRIDELVSQKDITNFFMPHSGGFIANYVFFSKKLKNKIKVNFYYEGILYFYDYQESYRLYHLKRILLGYTLGFKYHYVKNILPYNSDKIEKIYSPLKALTKGPINKIVELPFSSKIKKTPKEKDAYLILGGPINNLQDFYERILKTIIKNSGKSAVVYYKGHSSFLTHHKKDKEAFANIAKKHNINYQELDITSPVEALIKDLKISSIYSYYSSALVNIKLMDPQGYDIICYLNDKMKIIKDIEHVFKFLNIKIIRF